MQFGASIPRQKFATEFDAIWAASLRWRSALIGPLSRQFTALRSNPSDAVFYCTEFLTRDTGTLGGMSGGNESPDPRWHSSDISQKVPRIAFVVGDMFGEEGQTVSLYFDSLRADKAAASGRLETNSRARFVLPESEAASAAHFHLRSVRIHRRRGNNAPWEPDVALGSPGGLVDDRWELTITDEYMTLWNPLSSGFLSGMKEKPGKATGGVVPFADVERIQRGFVTSQGNAPHQELELVFHLETVNGVNTQTEVTIGFASENDARDISVAIADRLPACMESRARMAKLMLDMDNYAHPCNPLDAEMGQSFAKQASVDVTHLEMEMVKLRDLNWSDHQAELMISVI